MGKKFLIFSFMALAFLGTHMSVYSMTADGMQNLRGAGKGQNKQEQQEWGAHEVKEAQALITVAGQTWNVENPDGYEQLVSLEGRQCMESLGFSRQDIHCAILTLRAKGARSYQDLLKLPALRELAATDGGDRDDGKDGEQKKQNRAALEGEFLEQLSWHINFGSKARADEAESNLKDYYRWLKGLAIEKVLGVGLLVLLGTICCRGHHS